MDEGQEKRRPEGRKVLVSACLLGERVRYDGKVEPSGSAVLARWQQEGRVVPVCPEVAGGLPVPRPPAELQPDGRIVDVQGADATAAFHAGAAQALALALEHGITVAVLTEKSPSCGSALVFDGSFTRATRPGQGVTTQLLRQHGVQVFSEHQWELADAALREGAGSR